MSFKLLVLLTVLAVLESSSALKCYECTSNGHLDDCRAHQTADVCPPEADGCMEVDTNGNYHYLPRRNPIEVYFIDVILICTGHGSIKGCANIECDDIDPVYQVTYCKKCTTDLCNDK